jgi:hypothetical protein
MSFHPLSASRTREALREDAISQRDELRYWLLSSLIWLFYLYHAGWAGLQLNWFVLYDVVIAVAILWIGLNEAFKANGAEAGQDFVRRVVLVGVPLGVVVLLASQVLYWASWQLFPLVFDHRSFRDPSLAWQVMNFVIFNGIQAWFWWRICHHLALLNDSNNV